MKRLPIYSAMNRLSLMTLLAGAAMPATAIERVAIEGIGSMAQEEVAVFTQETDSMHAFADLAAKRILDYSEATGYEACGMIAKDQERFGIVITSNHSHIACAIQEDNVPQGMVSTGTDIHSHGLGAVKMNRADMRLLGIQPGAKNRHSRGTVYGQDRNRFSDVDLATGAGYLAAPSGTLYHDGKGRISRVEIDSTDTAKPTTTP